MQKQILHYKVHPPQHVSSQSILTDHPGQHLYSKGDKASLAVMDKQIYRLIGKATTLAA